MEETLLVPQSLKQKQPFTKAYERERHVLHLFGIPLCHCGSTPSEDVPILKLLDECFPDAYEIRLDRIGWAMIGCNLPYLGDHYRLMASLVSENDVPDIRCRVTHIIQVSAPKLAWFLSNDNAGERYETEEFPDVRQLTQAVVLAAFERRHTPLEALYPDVHRITAAAAGTANDSVSHDSSSDSGNNNNNNNNI